MEACGAAHHWARMLTGLGHTVKLLASEAVKPFVKQGKKNGATDAAAICEAASRPDVQFVPAKSAEQQGILALHAARSLLVKQQTMLANAMRGQAAEFGLPQGMRKLEALMGSSMATRPFQSKPVRRSWGRTITATIWPTAARLSKRRSSRMRATMRRHAVWRRSPASARLPRRRSRRPLWLSVCSKRHGSLPLGSAWCRDNIPPVGNRVWVDSPSRAIGKYASCWCWGPPQWSIGPTGGTAR